MSLNYSPFIHIYSYNACLCDEMVRAKKSERKSTIAVHDEHYAEYEFVKFQAPFGHAKISSAYLKLMDMCSFSN